MNLFVVVFGNKINAMLKINKDFKPVTDKDSSDNHLFDDLFWFEWHNAQDDLFDYTCDLNEEMIY